MPKLKNHRVSKTQKIHAEGLGKVASSLYLQALRDPNPSIDTLIRASCLDCCGGDTSAVNRCSIVTCVWHLRRPTDLPPMPPKVEESLDQKIARSISKKRVNNAWPAQDEESFDDDGGCPEPPEPEPGAPVFHWGEPVKTVRPVIGGDVQ
jgi:hypothetical protein